MTEDRVLYSETRPYTVADSLGELVGPTRGVVDLPKHLAWSGQRRFDLGDIRELSLMYEIVLREAMHQDDLGRFLNGAMLRTVWRDMYLPRRVRAMWESRFADLASAA